MRSASVKRIAGVRVDVRASHEMLRVASLWPFVATLSRTSPKLAKVSPAAQVRPHQS